MYWLRLLMAASVGQAGAVFVSESRRTAVDEPCSGCDLDGFAVELVGRFPSFFSFPARLGRFQRHPRIEGLAEVFGLDGVAAGLIEELLLECPAGLGGSGGPVFRVGVGP